MRNLTDAATVLRLRELVHSPPGRSALDRSSDTLPAFALRAVERALCDRSRPHRETVDVVDSGLGRSRRAPFEQGAIPQNSWIFGPFHRRR